MPMTPTSTSSATAGTIWWPAESTGGRSPPSSTGRSRLTPWRSCVRSGACRPFEKEYVHRDGHRVPVLIGAAVVSRNPLRWVSFVVDLTARQRAERERAEILARERVARAEADNDRERLTFLLRAGSLVAAARDRHELLQRACQVVVDSLADFCMVFLPDGDGLRATAIAYRDPARGTLSVDLSDETVPATHRAAVADRLRHRHQPGGGRRLGLDGPPQRGQPDARRHLGRAGDRDRAGRSAHGRPAPARRPRRRPQRAHGPVSRKPTSR